MGFLAASWNDAKYRVLKSYREWLRAVSFSFSLFWVLCYMENGFGCLLWTLANGYEQSPEIQTMYSLNMPVSAIRTKVRQEFEKHRYVQQLSAVDVLLFKSHAEFQVSIRSSPNYTRRNVINNV